MLARILLGYILALPLVLPLAIRAVEHQGYTIVVTMQAKTPGHLQVFYDRGEGFSEPVSSTAVLEPSDEFKEYRLAAPPGLYRHIRIDPGTVAGRYVLRRASILAADGSLHAEISLDKLAPLHQLVVLERRRDWLAVEAPANSNDPQLVYRPDEPLQMPDPWLGPAARWLLLQATLLCLCGAGLVWLIEVLLRRYFNVNVTQLSASCYRYQRAIIALAAVVSSATATYPVVFQGRSLVAPNNNGTPLLYDQAPYGPGSTDVVLENVRGSDVWAAILQEVPHTQVQREALAAGEVPLWNRYNAAGRPLWAQGLTSPLDPLHWLTLITPDPADGWDLKGVVHRTLFAWGMGLVALVATGNWRAGCLIAAASPFIGLYTFRLNHPAAFALTYVPWVLVAWFKLAAAATLRDGVRALICVACGSGLLLVAGTPKEAAVTLLATEAIGLMIVVLSPGTWRQCWYRAVAAAVSGVAVVLITAPHWLPFLDTLGKAFTLYDTPYVQFAGRQESLGFFLGPLVSGLVQPGLHLLGLVLLAAVVVEPRALFSQRGVLACAIGSAVLVAVAYGAVPASVIVRLPLLANVGHIHDVFLTAALPPLLVVCGLGADVLLRTTPARSMIVGGIITMVCWWLGSNLRNAPVSGSSGWWLMFLLVPVAAAFPSCLNASRFGSRRVLAAVGAGLAAAILVLPGSLHTEFNIAVVDELLLQPRLRARLDQDSPAVEAIHRAAAEPARAIGVDWTLFAGSQAFYALEGIGGADALELARYRELVDAAGIFRTMSWITMVRANDLQRLDPLLDLLNVGFVIVRPDAVPPAFVEVPAKPPDRVRVGRRETAWPRAFFVDGVGSYVDVADLLLKVASRRKPFGDIQGIDREANDATRELTRPSGEFIPAQRYKLTVNTSSFVVRATGPGIAVLSETYMPGDFHATVNGRRVPYFRVNHAFKAVVIPGAGDWEVTFEYRPQYWEVAWAMAGAGLLLLAGFGLATQRSRHVVEPTLSDKPAAQASS